MIAVAPSSKAEDIQGLKHGLPPISGWEQDIASIVQHDEPIFAPISNIDINQVKAGFACALHMHQPTVPAGHNGELISNLQYMFEHQGEGDNHNAGTFAWCYSRIADFVKELAHNGCNPRIMLDYSGNLLWGFQQMNRHDILDNLKSVTCDPNYYLNVEWLGTMWSHAVATSTPIPDLKLQIQAWQHHFASIFGYDALRRVKGFSPPEMHLPNHPDTLYEYIKALKECGYRWLLVQEDSVERLNGDDLHKNRDDKYVPNRLVACNSQGEEISITALIKTQGSDTKLVAQMQPYHEAKSRERQKIGNIEVPGCVSQIADGENGGVMMNEFPDGYKSAFYQAKDQGNVVGLNGTEYIELLEQAGVNADDYPVCQARGQHKIWAKVARDQVTPEALAKAIEELQEADQNFHMDGASWTNDLSWVKGYENVLEPMNQLSADFHRKFDSLVEQDPGKTRTPEYQEALLYNMLVETSCFRYWGQGTWTDYARELYNRGEGLAK
ncbi:MAG TPA: glycosyl hydrolase family 57 [Cyanothece sp. UBA12306]|nr:glycosyl hydrolase family 57 [Cyanothece sp. UBA12306]